MHVRVQFLNTFSAVTIAIVASSHQRTGTCPITMREMNVAPFT
jgi:hypothetical protein